MDRIRFGRTDLAVSQLCLGTMSMGSSAWKGWVLDEGDSIPILRRALDLGINFFDGDSRARMSIRRGLVRRVSGAP